MERERLAVVLNCEGMGDCLFAIPVLKKLRDKLADQFVLDLITHNPTLFTACPYVERVYARDEFGHLPADMKSLALFDTSKLPHWAVDTFDFLTIPTGIGELSFREKQLEYFPVEPDRAETFDVVLNTSQTWPSRSWAIENWQRLADMLTGKNLKVAVVGKNVRSRADSMDKCSVPLEGCHDLVNKLSLDQTYFTIRKCGLFVSCQNGLSVLSGSTETELVILDMAIEWSKRAIYRHENPLHRVTYVKGDCGRYCGSAFRCPHPVDGREFKCVPAYDRVAAVVEDKVRELGLNAGAIAA